ncbi:MAG: hypothetical protein GVY19_10715 [Bacteroidetes bacterium]|jgi:hypothetical protein|nr:hypothetical protein [Bacteroidota bacterium]
MKNILFILLFIISFTGCEKWMPEGELVTRHHFITAVNHLFVNENIHVTIVPAWENSIEITAPKKLIDGITYQVEADSLRLRNRNKHNWLYYDDSVHVTIYFGNRLASINSKGTGNIVSTGQINTHNLLLYAWEGSGRYALDVNVSHQLRIIAHSKTTTDFIISGQSTILSTGINGRGVVNTTEMYCSNAGIVHNGPNDLYIYTDFSLRAQIASSGNVYFVGNPEKIVETISQGSTGKLIALDKATTE